MSLDNYNFAICKAASSPSLDHQRVLTTHESADIKQQHEPSNREIMQSMSETQLNGFHKVAGVKITHGVVHSGWFSTQEKVSILLPAKAVGEKEAVGCLAKPEQYAQTRHTPGVFYYSGPASFWLHKDTVFVDFRSRKRHDVKALADRFLQPKTRTSSRGKSRRQAKRETIPKQVKIDVWQRDNGQCVECDRRENLEFDHIIPVKLGGANTFRNVQLLCGDCNRSKGARL